MEDRGTTSSALLEQLVYIDNYINGAGVNNSSNQFQDESLSATPNLDIDGQLSLDLAAFADDAFVFPDEEKKQQPSSSNNVFEQNNHELVHNSTTTSNNLGTWNLAGLDNYNHNRKNNNHDANNQFSDINLDSTEFVNITDLPKFPVPPGAQQSLEKVGLSQNQIDLLSALIAQHLNNNNSNKSLPGLDPANNLPSDINKIKEFRNHQPITSANLSSSVSPMDTFQMNSAITTPSASTYQRSSNNSNNNNQLDDKKRRNTMASARFRIKKKLKEKEMEKRITNLTNLITNLENQLINVETENRILKSLIIQKNTDKSNKELQLLKEKVKSNTN